MSKKEREEAEKQFKSIRERKPFEELRQAAKVKPREIREKEDTLRSFIGLLANYSIEESKTAREYEKLHKKAVALELYIEANKIMKIVYDKDEHAAILTKILEKARKMRL